MTHASLFSGIGGAELAASWLEWTNMFHCEINPFGRKVLEYWFPNTISYEDITKTDFSEWRGRVDVLTGGFPCQPFSVAGRRKGADDDRYLWPEMLRVIREVQPSWIVGENVAGILSMVQPGCEIEMGGGSALFDENNLYRTEQKFVIETIFQDFEREGYFVQPFVIPACSVGAPHKRDRVWFIANRTDTRIETMQCEREDGVCPTQSVTNADISIIKRKCEKEQRKTKPNRRSVKYIQSSWCEFPTQSPVCTRDDGFPGRLAGITFPKWRSESIKVLGNAWVPQVAYEIFKAIEELSKHEQRT